jgi:uncharacterized protein
MPTHSQDLVESLGLLPHPEGGYYLETYRAEGTIPQQALSNDFNGPRHFSTAIYYLLPEGERSRLHRIASDEVWHFYAGGPLAIIEIDATTGQWTETFLGPNLSKGQRFQHVVKAHCWFGAKPLPGSEFCLVGCTVAPGFDFQEFELAEVIQLKMTFPQLSTQLDEFEK